MNDNEVLNRANISRLLGSPKPYRSKRDFMCWQVSEEVQVDGFNGIVNVAKGDYIHFDGYVLIPWQKDEFEAKFMKKTEDGEVVPVDGAWGEDVELLDVEDVVDGENKVH